MEVPCPHTGAMHLVQDGQTARLQREHEALKRLVGKLLALMPAEVAETFAPEKEELGL